MKGIKQMKIKERLKDFVRELIHNEDGGSMVEIFLGVILIIIVGIIFYATKVAPLTEKANDFGNEANVKLERVNRIMENTKNTYISEIKQEISAGKFTVTVLDASDTDITASVSNLPDDGVVTLTAENKDEFSNTTSKTYKIIPD